MFLLDFTRKPFQLSEKQVLLSILKTGQKFKASFAKQGLSSADLPFLSLILLSSKPFTRDSGLNSMFPSFNTAATTSNTDSTSWSMKPTICMAFWGGGESTCFLSVALYYFLKINHITDSALKKNKNNNNNKKTKCPGINFPKDKPIKRPEIAPMWGSILFSGFKLWFKEPWGTSWAVAKGACKEEDRGREGWELSPGFPLWLQTNSFHKPLQKKKPLRLFYIREKL